MDFFAYQQAARRNTVRLVILFMLAVLLIVAALNVILLPVVQPASAHEARQAIAVISGLALAVIAGGSLWRFFQLLGGGRKVADMLGARPINPNTSNIQDKRLLNVVEEMSLAAGIPVPALYVMEEETAINALVAGLRPTDAVMVVTRGALTQLDRDQLQGVVAHEFSHIFHGDMRLNIRLIMVLGGLLAIGRIGLEILQHAPRARDKGGVPLALVGLAIAAVGFIGILFGELIKAGVSRQREFLADATAVQYTRNPRGLAGALHKIQNQGSKLENRNALEVSHLCFGAGINLGRWLATHPPLAERIARLQGHAAGPAAHEEMPRFAAAGMTTDSAALLASVGHISPAHLHYAQILHHSLPLALVAHTRAPEAAQVLVYALLLRENSPGHSAWRRVLVGIGGDSLYLEVEQARTLLEQHAPRLFLPLLELALPTLKGMDAQNRKHFLKIAQALIESDSYLSVFEYLTWTLLVNHLEPKAGRAPAVKYRRFTQVTGALSQVLSLLAYAGRVPETAYTKALAVLGVNTPRLPESACSAQATRQALQQLAQLTPDGKREFLRACAECVLHDGQVSVREGEALRLVAEVLDCPMPPLVTAAVT